MRSKYSLPHFRSITHRRAFGEVIFCAHAGYASTKRTDYARDRLLRAVSGFVGGFERHRKESNVLDEHVQEAALSSRDVQRERGGVFGQIGSLNVAVVECFLSQLLAGLCRHLAIGLISS